MDAGLLTTRTAPQRVAAATFVLAGVLLGASLVALSPYVALVITALGLAAYCLVRRPALVLPAMVVAVFAMNVQIGLRRVPAGQIFYEVFNLEAVDFVVFLSIAVVVIGRATGRISPVRGRARHFILLLLFALAATSLLWTPNPRHGATVMVHIFSCFMLLVLPPVLLRDRNTLKAVLWSWCVACAAAGVLGLLTLDVAFKELVYGRYCFSIAGTEFEFRTFVFGNIGQRVGGVGDPNRVAFISNTGLLAAIALVMTVKKRIAWFLALALGLFIFYVDVHGFSKGGTGSLWMGMSLFIFLHPRLKGKRFVWLGVFFATFAAILISISFIDMGGSFGRFGKSPIETRGRMSLGLRFKWWRTDLDMLAETRGLGAGVGSLGPYVWGYAQSFYFSLLAELGLLGAFLIIWFGITYFSDLWSTMWRIKGDDFWLTAALAFSCGAFIFFVHTLVDFAYVTRMVWLLLGMALACAEAGRRESEAEPRHTPQPAV